MGEKPNILFFFTDDQRFDTIRALGDNAIQTPNLDRLVASGTAFTRAHIPGGTSGAVCMPSRAMLHTGRTLFHIEGEGQGIPMEHTTLGECLQTAGYDSYGIGKWHNGRESFARSFNGGDEIFFGGMQDHWNVPAYHYDPTGHYESRYPFVMDPSLTNMLQHRQCDHMTLGKHSSELFADAAVSFLECRSSARPFFLYVSLLAPHDPRTMPGQFRTMYDPGEVELPRNFMPRHPIDTGALDIRDERLAQMPREPSEIQRHIAEYYAMISHLDHEFGRVIEALESTGQRENTIIVFAGDNGLAVGQHGLMGKQNLYDHSVRVPLIFAGPGVPEGEERDTRAYLLDIFPTLCELTDTAVPGSVEGKSLVPSLGDPGVSLRDSLYLAYAGTIRGIRSGGHKLVEYAANGTRGTQLFDLEEDPLEMRNLIGENGMEDVVAGLRSEMHRFRDDWDDTAHPLGQTFWENEGTWTE